MSSPAVTRSKKPSAPERTPSNPPQPRKPRSRKLSTPSIVEVPATHMVINTRTLPPTSTAVAPLIQNTASPVRFHTPNASPPNPPDKDDDDDEDKNNPSDSDSESEEDNNEKKKPPCQWTLHFGSYNDRTTVFNQLKASPIPGTQPHDGCQPLYGEIMIGLFFVYLNYTTI